MKPVNVRNITIIGHSSVGKTTLAESLLYKSGSIPRKGRIEDGSTVLDFDPEEVKRGVTVNLGLAHLGWKKTILNIIDTPGFFDFEGEVRSGLRVADNAIVVLNAEEGVEVGTEIYCKIADTYNLPKIFFINKCTLEEIDPISVVSQIQEIFGKKAIPLQFPIGKGKNFTGVIDLLSGDLSGSDDQGTAEAWRESSMESIIELSEELLELYLAGEEIPQNTLLDTLKTGVANGEIYPILFGDALQDIGIEELLDALVNYAASPVDRPPVKLINKEEVELSFDSPEPVCFVFKTFSDPHLGELYYVRVYSGAIKSGIELVNARTERTEKINQIFKVRGKDREETSELPTGMLGVLVKLKDTHTNDTLRSAALSGHLPEIEFPAPRFSLAIIPKTKQDEERVSEGLTRLHSEDPTFSFRYDPELKQTIISGLGEVHLDVIVSKLREKFRVSVDTETPKVPYREAIRKPAQGFGKYVKQTGGRGQYGICYIKIEPLQRGQGYEFVDAIFGGAIPQNFRPSVETGIKKAMEKGVLASVPVVDVKVTLYDGKYHPVDSSNLAFEIAGSLAFKDAEEKADPYLLEPIYELEVTVPEEYMGDIIGDINARRGRILGMEARGRYQVIKALVPLAEMHKYATQLRSITKGRGNFTMKFSHYDEVPREIADRIIAQLREEKE